MEVSRSAERDQGLRPMDPAAFEKAGETLLFMQGGTPLSPPGQQNSWFVFKGFYGENKSAEFKDRGNFADGFK